MSNLVCFSIAMLNCSHREVHPNVVAFLKNWGCSPCISMALAPHKHAASTLSLLEPCPSLQHPHLPLPVPPLTSSRPSYINLIVLATTHPLFSLPSIAMRPRVDLATPHHINLAPAPPFSSSTASRHGCKPLALT
jgi:hypothetical protein